MRKVVLALLALVLTVAMVDTAQARQKKDGGDKDTKQVRPGKEVKGKLVKVDVNRKILEVKTAKGLVKVPVKGKLLLRKDQKGRPTPLTLSGARRLGEVDVIIIIRHGGVVIIIIVR